MKGSVRKTVSCQPTEQRKLFSDLYEQNGSGCLFPFMSDVSSSSLRVHHFQPTKNPLHALCFLSSSFFHSSLLDTRDCVFLSFMHVLFCFSYVNKLVFNSSLSFFLSFSLSFSLLQLNPFSEIQQGGTSLSFFLLTCKQAIIGAKSSVHLHQAI